jgi:ADP-heptose:LPS heptosyltransferase
MELSNINKILIINLGGIGDVTLSLPAVAAIRRKFPGAALEMVVAPRAADWLRSQKLADNVHGFPGRFSEVIRLLICLRRRRFDLCVNMRTMVSRASALKIRFMLACIGGRVSAGRDTDGRGAFFDIRIPETNAGRKPEMEYDNDTARVLGAVVTGGTPEVDVAAEDIVSAEKKLRDSGVMETEKYAIVNPGGMPSRRWPAVRFRAVVKALASTGRLRIVVIGSAAEAGIAEYVADAAPGNAVSVAGKFTVNELWALLRGAAAVITNDTGPMHMAAVLRVPLVAVFGPGDLMRYDPRIVWPKARVVYKGKDRIVCNAYRCRRMSCLRAISVDEVLREVSSVLEGSALI